MKVRIGSPSIPSGLRLGITLIIVLMVISSPVVMLVDPFLLAASPGADVTTYAPSTLSQGGSDFTAQAPLSPPASYLSNDLVGSNTIYELVFVPTTSGIIKKVEMTFPAGTGISAVGVLDRVGIGGGTLSKAGTTVTFTVNNAVSVPAGTFIRLELVNVKSPLSPSSAYQVTVTTRDPANGVIDGPTPSTAYNTSTAYNIRRIGSNDIADNAVTTPKIADGAITSTKPAESFMKRVTLTDGFVGNAKGWNPDGVTTDFTISEPLVVGLDTSLISINLNGVGVASVCNVNFLFAETGFGIKCTTAPPAETELHYVVENLPGHLDPP